ncbi:ribonuclease P protein subunit p25-like protein [Cotesia glomerata]|nr:ribonuclease P protein subunit p25-like protein [Cotesia glomerata]XP_044583769.1 ribonuclease P protein subunit p25-like protein [Cotesia glomerata]XP_044583770.1 ribonuclease P protein subunit p25-like protein [Cotesia glomerata]
MTRNKKNKLIKNDPKDDDAVEEIQPIPGLSEKYLKMQVNSGTKIRNVLKYALKYFDEDNCVLWTGAGKGIEKTVTCVEIFKREKTGLHQINKIRYVKSKREGDKPNLVPEINIFLSKAALDTSELGYQAPGDLGMFEDSNVVQSQGSKSRMSEEAMKEFAEMGLRTGQKRSRKKTNNDGPIKKGKKA